MRGFFQLAVDPELDPPDGQQIGFGFGGLSGMGQSGEGRDF